MAPGAALRWVLCVHAASFSADRTWKVTWNGVLAGVVITFVGREVGSEILQEETCPYGKPNAADLLGDHRGPVPVAQRDLDRQGTHLPASAALHCAPAQPDTRVT